MIQSGAVFVDVALIIFYILIPSILEEIHADDVMVGFCDLTVMENIHMFATKCGLISITTINLLLLLMIIINDVECK